MDNTVSASYQYNHKLMTQWLTTLLVQNLSSHTIKSYRSALTHINQYLTNKGLKWTQCDKRAFSRYIAQRLEINGISNRSVQSEISAIRQFYTWLIKHNHTRINPTTGFQLKAAPRPLPKIADIDLISQLLDQPLPTESKLAKLWKRDQAMFELLYGSGLRVSELVSLDVNNLDMPQKQLRVLGKGHKTRLVPISRKSIEAINDYLTERFDWITKRNPAEMALFISERRGTRLTTRTVQQRLKLRAKQAGIAQNFYPHLLRHCFASHVLSDSGDLRAVQEMLGHSDISTTQIYTQVDFAKLTQIYDNSHPRATLSSHKQNK